VLFSSQLAEGIYWCFGWVFEISDSKIVAGILEVNPILFGLSYLPIFVAVSIAILLKIKRHVGVMLNG